MADLLPKSAQRKYYLGIIPARGGSRGIHRKNIVPVAGRPLIEYTIEAALESRRLHRTILSTDDDEIAQVSASAGVEVPFVRPENLSGDEATVEQVVTHSLDWLENNEGYVPDAFMILQPTAPLRTADDIDESILVFEREGVDAVVGVSEPREHPSDMVFFKNSRMEFLLPNMGYNIGVQRQNYHDCYFINGAIYIVRTGVFRQTGSRFEETALPYVMDPLKSVDVDTPEDLCLVELLLQQRQSAD